MDKPTRISNNIEMFIDENKNVVIFPNNWTEGPTYTCPDGEKSYAWLPSYFPIELKYPYTMEELAEKIEYGIGECGKHECYPSDGMKNTVMAKYYGVKSFRKAMFGKRYIQLRRNFDDEKFEESFWQFQRRVDLCVAYKGVYMYEVLHSTQLPKEASFLDYAKVVMDYIEVDVTQYDRFKKNKKRLNWPEA